MQSQKLAVTEQYRDRFARTAEVTLSRFTLSTPYFFTLVKNSDEFRLLIELTNGSHGDHFGGCVVRIFDAHKVVGDRMANVHQRALDLPSSLVEESYLKYVGDHPIIVDPATEHTYYLSDLGKWANDEHIHPKLRSFAQVLLKGKKRKVSRKWRRGKNWMFWNYDVSRDSELRHELISSSFDVELHYGASALLAPGPLVYDDVNLETAMEINTLAKDDALDKDAEFGNYFILSADAILDKALRDTLGDFLAASPVHLSVLKFKFLNLRYATMDFLEAYADFYRRLAEIREQKREKIFCVLENDCQAFVSATVAFDLVSTSMTGYDRYPRGKAKEGYGGLFSMDELAHIKFENCKEAYVNNGDKPLCDHKPCQNIDPRTVTKSAWYAIRRKHYVLCMEDLMTKIANYVHDRNIEQARQDVTNSFMSPLKKLIPTQWESPPAVYPTP